MRPRSRRDRRLGDGEILFAQGEPGALVYTVESGLIQLVRQRDDGAEEVVERNRRRSVLW